jgi:hypothetical protein
MARHKLSRAERIKGAKALLKSSKAPAGLKAWARKFLKGKS